MDQSLVSCLQNSPHEKLPGLRLERYTIKRPHEILIVTAEIAGDMEQALIFKGFSSSLMRPTSPDPDNLVLPEQADIMSIDRLEGPYNPDRPQYIAQGISWQQMLVLLDEVGE